MGYMKFQVVSANCKDKNNINPMPQDPTKIYKTKTYLNLNCCTIVRQNLRCTPLPRVNYNTPAIADV